MFHLTYFNFELSNYNPCSFPCHLLGHSQIRVDLIITSRHVVFENAKKRFEKSLAFWYCYHLFYFPEWSSNDQIIKSCKID